MRALILAADRSHRLGNLCEQKPSCMISLNRKPLIQHQTDTLRQAGTKELAIVSGYQSQCLRGRADRDFFNARWAESGVVRSLITASVWFGTESVIVSYGDVFFTRETVQKLVASDADIGVVYDPNWLSLWQARYENPLSEAESFSIDDSGAITEIGGPAKQLKNVKGQFTGLLRISENGWWTIMKTLSQFCDQQIDRMDTTELLKHVINQGGRVTGVTNHGEWGEVVVPSDLPIYEQRLAS